MPVMRFPDFADRTADIRLDRIFLRVGNEGDPRFPIRVTAQFYQATATGLVGPAEMDRLAALVEGVYRKGDWIGSPVVPSGPVARRPTAWDGISPPPPEVSWRDFPGLGERGWSRPWEAIGIR